MNIPDQFLSEEDLDLKNLTEEELHAYWNFWLKQAQATNDEDAHTYSHGVFMWINDKEPNRPQTTDRKSNQAA